MNKNYFSINKNDGEYKLYDYTGNIFFILKKKLGCYHTSNLYQYEDIVDEIKNWLIVIIKNNPDKIRLESITIIKSNKK